MNTLISGFAETWESANRIIQKTIGVNKKFLLLLASLIVLQAQARVIYVRVGAPGDGSSWQQATGNLQHALRISQPGDEIWVAAGVYTPSSTNDRAASFVIPSGVKVLGGFAGRETALSQRDFSTQRSVLSGNIGLPNSDTDNSYSVITTRNVNEHTLVDGFEIVGGNANNPVHEVSAGNCGGGWFNDASNGISAPTISNCVFKFNKAFYGGAIYNYAGNGNCSGTRVLNCDFIQNDARVDGGGIYNQGASGRCNVLIQSCNFEGNQAYYGAGILNRADFGEANPTIENCAFSGNGSMVRGSAIYNHRSQSGSCNPVLKGCRFDDTNFEMVGDAIGGNSVLTNQEDAKKPKKPVVIRSTTGY